MHTETFLERTALVQQFISAIVISGPPASGKSTFAASLRERVRWPLISKDQIKEQIFDVLGWQDRQWSQSVSLASYALMFSWARELATARMPFMLEGNFRPGAHDGAFRSLTQMGVQWIQVFCTADREVLVHRFAERAGSTSRHPGHVDLQSVSEIEAELLSTPMQPIAIDGELLHLDTTQLDDARVAQLIERISNTVSVYAYPDARHTGA